MSSIATLNGVQYIIPAYNDTGWAQGAGNLSLYLAAVAANTLQPTGGAFTLTADVDFGASFGIKALFLKTETANPASAGVVRLAKTDTIKWRNNANGADLSLTIDGSDNLTYAATKVLLSGAVVNADINASAAIAYSKLALTGAILNADLAGSIAYSKLSLTGAILNADLAGSIAYSKLSLTGAILNADLAGSIAYSKLTLTGAILNADVNASAAIAVSKLAAMTASRDIRSDSSGFLAVKPLAVMATTTSVTTVTSSTFTDTALTASIIPSSTAARIKVSISGDFENNSLLATNVCLTIKRNSTNLASTNGFASISDDSAATGSLAVPVSVTYIDSPASSSSVTYTVQIRSSNNVNSCKFPVIATAVMILEEIS